MEDLNKAKSVIYGLAIGDALGWPTEFLTLDRVKAKYGADGIHDLPDPALFTDDTQMSVAVAEALIKAGNKDIESIMEAVQEEFVKWLHSPENNRAPGGPCLRGVANMAGPVGLGSPIKGLVRPCHVTDYSGLTFQK